MHFLAGPRHPAGIDKTCPASRQVFSRKGQAERDQQLNDTCQLMNRACLPPA